MSGLTLERRLRRSANRVSARARLRYAEALQTDSTRYAVGSPAWFRLEALAAVGWPANALRFWRDFVALHTAHPGDEWVDLERELEGVVIRQDNRGTWLRVTTREQRLNGVGGRERVLVPPYRYVAWSPVSRGWLA